MSKEVITDPKYLRTKEIEKYLKRIEDAEEKVNQLEEKILSLESKIDSFLKRERKRNECILNDLKGE